MSLPEVFLHRLWNDYCRFFQFFLVHWFLIRCLARHIQTYKAKLVDVFIRSTIYPDKRSFLCVEPLLVVIFYLRRLNLLVPCLNLQIVDPTTSTIGACFDIVYRCEQLSNRASDSYVACWVQILVDLTRHAEDKLKASNVVTGVSASFNGSQPHVICVGLSDQLVDVGKGISSLLASSFIAEN